MVKLSFYKQIHEIGQQNTYYLNEMIWTNSYSIALNNGRLQQYLYTDFHELSIIITYSRELCN